MPFEDGEASAIKLCSLISGIIICSPQTSETLLHPLHRPPPPPTPMLENSGSFQEPTIRCTIQQLQTAGEHPRGCILVPFSRRAMWASEAAVPRSSAAKR